MICQLINFKKIASLTFAIFSCFFSFSQEASKLYHHKYSKFSFVFQPSLLKNSYADNRGNSTYPSMSFNSSKSYQFGFYYNFAQSGNFNFKTGLIAKDFSPSFDLHISNEDIGYGTNYSLTDYKPYNQFIFSIPIKAEFILPVNQKFNLSFGASLNLNLITGVNDEITTIIYVHNNDSTLNKDIFYSKTDSQEKINISSEISTGLQYKSKFALIQLDAYWTLLSAPTPITGKYYIYNLEKSEDINGDFKIDPLFYGISLIVSPKKDWLKRKKK